MLPLGAYCADIAADAATIHASQAVSAVDMPGFEADEMLASFDEVA